ncbi:hypothetical protein [Aureimonas frigidaquae]|nr:hypothetical protein [Aureimonas frigidaquae]
MMVPFFLLLAVVLALAALVPQRETDITAGGFVALVAIVFANMG